MTCSQFNSPDVNKSAVRSEKDYYHLTAQDEANLRRHFRQIKDKRLLDEFNLDMD
jgi:hypothetical protein